MAEHSTIEWTDATWNIITGCSVLSPGCRGCYAMKLAGTRLRNHPSRVGLTTPSSAGPVWNGQVRFNEQWLDQPQRWRRPREIFVCAHGDLFHESVPDAWIDQVFAVMHETPWHTYQVLTKRARRMREYMTMPGLQQRIWDTVARLALADKMRILEDRPSGDDTWPLPNVIMMVSAERQQEADERIPELLATPAAMRGLSLEPLIGPIVLPGFNAETSWCPNCRAIVRDSLFDPHERKHGVAAAAAFDQGKHCASVYDMVHWVIAGGESGDRARPAHPEWLRSLRDQCAAAGVPFHFKQWGEWEPRDEWARGNVRQCAIKVDGTPVDDDDAPQDVGGQRFAAVGKKTAGRLLEGVEHNGRPA